ncbi:hypothetical protein TVAG_143450 [Trichomonas vaginalis G3]|uniref:Uncharacterized protein n=1 Tax=Trichomonas vaginalis (strain ATCC PRA-98 / G3) TaxID=412133 RepID=A2EWE1_TRIV3|nr:hypothetical protein TVAGG3_0353580 [Trichomonas vaginalis G3]EAY03045.1 hypothetical protein TVAG_143450 [Trichomonas vaginalis G3]KAI5531469.1 hypothetical protein TVAGG3_0353580 [Trichomonas vaginalis G3]|eukprot:XP_001315268.1 hypothetical protein [Trichomonas vaginalis G3]
MMMTLPQEIIKIYVGSSQFIDTCQNYFIRIKRDSNPHIMKLFFNVFLSFLNYNNSVLISNFTQPELFIDRLLDNMDNIDVNMFLSSLFIKQGIYMSTFVLDTNIVPKLINYIPQKKQAALLLLQIVQNHQFDSSILQPISDPDTVFSLFDEYNPHCYDIIRILLKNSHLTKESWDLLYEQFPDLCMRINADQDKTVSIAFPSMTELFKEILKSIILENSGIKYQNKVNLSPPRKQPVCHFEMDKYVSAANSLSSCRSCPIFDIDISSLPAIDETSTSNGSLLISSSEEHEYDTTIVKTSETILTKMLTCQNNEHFRKTVLDIFDLIIDTRYLLDLLLTITNCMNLIKNAFISPQNHNCKQTLTILNKLRSPVMGSQTLNIPLRSTFAHQSYSCETIPE